MGRVNQAASSDFGREPALRDTEFPSALHGPPMHALAFPSLLPRAPGAMPRVQHILRLDLVSDVCSYGHFGLGANAHQEPPQVSHVLVQ